MHGACSTDVINAIAGTFVKIKLPTRLQMWGRAVYITLFKELSEGLKVNNCVGRCETCNPSQIGSRLSCRCGAKTILFMLH